MHVDLLTGLVIDYEVLSSYCHACALKQNAKQQEHISEEELDSWREAHKDCAKNFSGSSKAMEQESAKRMWARSVNRHQVRYTEMLSDGDSAAFREVVALNPYPGHEMYKLECINHAHKRMGTALREIAHRVGWEGKVWGSSLLINAKLCNCPSINSANHQGSLDQMKAAIWAGLLHCMSTDDNPLHTRCDPSWCWYRKAEDKGEIPDSHKHHAGTFST